MVKELNIALLAFRLFNEVSRQTADRKESPSVGLSRNEIKISSQHL